MVHFTCRNSDGDLEPTRPVAGWDPDVVALLPSLPLDLTGGLIVDPHDAGWTLPVLPCLALDLLHSPSHPSLPERRPGPCCQAARPAALANCRPLGHVPICLLLFCESSLWMFDALPAFLSLYLSWTWPIRATAHTSRRACPQAMLCCRTLPVLLIRCMGGFNRRAEALHCERVALACGLRGGHAASPTPCDLLQGAAMAPCSGEGSRASKAAVRRCVARAKHVKAMPAATLDILSCRMTPAHQEGKNQNRG